MSDGNPYDLEAMHRLGRKCLNCKAAEAKLVQAEQEKAGLKQALIEVDEMIRVLRLDMAAGRVKSRSEIAAEARLATQEAAIRQVEKSILAIADQLVNDEPNLARELGGLADTLRAILPAEQTGEKPQPREIMLCVTCGEPILAGQAVAYLATDRDKALIHARCPRSREAQTGET